MNLPNLITIARILLVPLTVWLLISDAFGLAFLAFVLAGISDGVDGFIAKQFNQRTELGAHLDPLADKALLVSVYVTLGFLKVLPAWLVIIVVSRDVLIVSAFMLSWLMDHPVRVQPLLLSKVNTAGQIILVVTLLGAAAIAFDLQSVLLAGEMAVAILTIASGGQYLYEWVRHMAGASA